MTGPSSPRIPQLDGLRGIAILLVIVWHYVVAGLDPASNALTMVLFRFLSLTWSGVDLFFMLSGFLVGGMLLKHLGSPNYYRAFFVRRAARILPLYFAWIGLFIFVGSAFPGLDLFRDAHPIWTYVLFLQNIAMALRSEWGTPWLSVTWSLAVEVQFYLIIPLLIRQIPPRRLPRVLVTLVVLAPVVRTLLIFNGLVPQAPYALLPARMDALLLGVLCAWMLRDPATHSYLRNHYAELCRVAGLVGAMDLFFLFQHPPLFAPTTVIVGYSLLDVLYACILLIVLLDHNHILARLTTFRPLTALGVIAYGVYIFHLPLLDLFDRSLFGMSFLVPTLIALGCTVALAWFSWQCFEKPFLALGHRAQFDQTICTAGPCTRPAGGGGHSL